MARKEVIDAAQTKEGQLEALEERRQPDDSRLSPSPPAAAASAVRAALRLHRRRRQRPLPIERRRTAAPEKTPSQRSTPTAKAREAAAPGVPPAPTRHPPRPPPPSRDVARPPPRRELLQQRPTRATWAFRVWPRPRPTATASSERIMSWRRASRIRVRPPPGAADDVADATPAVPCCTLV